MKCASKYAISRLHNQQFSGEGAQPPAKTPPVHRTPHPWCFSY